MNTIDKDYDYLVKLLLIGDAGVGKSTLCEKLSRGEFINSYNSTIGVDFFSLFVPIDHKIYKLQIWDTAGQERFKAITRSYYKNSKIVLFMIDLHDTEGLDKMERYLNEVKTHCDDNVKIIVIGNKNDLQINIDKEKLNEILIIDNLPYIELSVKNEPNFEHFYELLHITINNLPNNYFKQKNFNIIQLDDIKQKNKKCCIIS